MEANQTIWQQMVFLFSQIGKTFCEEEFYMAQIRVSNVTFGYEGSIDNVFEDVSFVLDTDWKLGFIGRNGRGKTTFLNLLLGKYEYRGTIKSPACFDYFPYILTQRQRKLDSVQLMEEIRPDRELWRVICELEHLSLEADILYRPFDSLSYGEQTKVMLAILFSGENYFLLVDEPTNHLDYKARDQVKEYLNTKKGFILVSHDRELLDACVDHVLVLNRSSITVERGNFTSWLENKEKRDTFETAENEKHRREIKKLEAAAWRSRTWADKNEKTKIGFDPVKETDRPTRAYIGAKTKKMQSRVKQIEKRTERAIQQKEGLLKDQEIIGALKLMPLDHHKEVYIQAKNCAISYQMPGTQSVFSVFRDFNFALKRGERILLQGENGSGKSSFIKAILEAEEILLLNDEKSPVPERRLTGELQIARGLRVSYINQDTSFLRGGLTEYIRKLHMDESRFKAILRQLDFDRSQFEKNMKAFSEGQKKKVLIASSLLTQAHLYIWDEPLNYIDVFSRMQIEKVILYYQPTMLLIEHDRTFGEKVATRRVTFETFH